MINHCLSNYRKNYHYPLIWQQRRKKGGCFQLCSILGSETRPSVVTQRNQEGHEILLRQINQLPTGSIRQMSWKQWEALLFLKKGKRNFPLWQGLFINRLCRESLLRGEQGNSKICKYSLTCKEQFADPFISFPR